MGPLVLEASAQLTVSHRLYVTHTVNIIPWQDRNNYIEAGKDGFKITKFRTPVVYVIKLFFEEIWKF